MPDFLRSLLDVAVPTYPPNSRYAGTALLTITDADGNPIRYLARRFLPDPNTLVEVGVVTVRDGDRLDLLSATLQGDPELQWRLADANRAMFPGELEAPGETLRVTLPEGIPGARGA